MHTDMVNRDEFDTVMETTACRERLSRDAMLVFLIVRLTTVLRLAVLLVREFMVSKYRLVRFKNLLKGILMIGVYTT